MMDFLVIFGVYFFNLIIIKLGVVLYIMIIGKVPFKGSNLHELHKNIVNGDL
jgi:hypothetical protein